MPLVKIVELFKTVEFDYEFDESTIRDQITGFSNWEEIEEHKLKQLNELVVWKNAEERKKKNCTFYMIIRKDHLPVKQTLNEWKAKLQEYKKEEEQKKLEAKKKKDEAAAKRALKKKAKTSDQEKAMLKELAKKHPGLIKEL